MAEDDDDDLFGVFGDSDDDEEEEGTRENGSSGIIAKSLIEKANQQMIVNNNNNDAKNNNNNNNGTAIEKEAATTLGNKMELLLAKMEFLEFPLWPSPLFLAPMVKVAKALPGVGGGRGFVALEDLCPGTLILVEEPMVLWPDEQIGKALDLVSIEHLLYNSNAQQIIAHLEHLHPTKYVVDHDPKSNLEQIENMTNSLHEQYKQDSRLSNLLQKAQNDKITNRAGTALTEKDIVRILLSLRYNGLESGIYLHAAMLNHNCFPNCVKFLPTSNKSYSEVRTTRHVSAGESLTISYVPKIMSFASRRRYLWNQHRFDIGDTVIEDDLKQMELINGKFPKSTIRESTEEDDQGNPKATTTTTSRIENAIMELDSLLVALSSHVETQQGTENNSSLWEDIKALEVSTKELYVEARYQLRNDRHVLFIPCLRLHLDTCYLVLKDPLSLTSSQRLKLLSRMIETARKLVELQKLYYGPDHFDLARTNLDLAQAIEELLSKSPKELVALKVPGLNTFASWSSLEHQTRKEYERIKTLYPNDAGDYISSSSNNK